MDRISLYLENGIFLEADSFGATGTSVGEIVFNTSITGYQEIVTDPSYAGQFITFTMPEIGNVGCNEQDMESRRAYCNRNNSSLLSIKTFKFSFSRVFGCTFEKI